MQAAGLEMIPSTRGAIAVPLALAAVAMMFVAADASRAADEL